MKILIAVISCHKYDLKTACDWYKRHDGEINLRTQVVRETWAKNAGGFDLRFFYGYGAKRKMADDEILLSVDDSYRGLVHKVKAVVRWALSHGYDYILKVDDDTYVSKEVLALLNAGDYVGHSTSTEANAGIYAGNMESEQAEKLLDFGGNYACGGCYLLSRKAMEIIDRTKITPKSFEFMGIPNLYDTRNPIPPCEDRWVGHTLERSGITLVHDKRYSGQTDDIEIVRERLRPALEYSQNHALNEADFKAFLLLMPLLHFNCNPDEMRKLYEAGK